MYKNNKLFGASFVLILILLGGAFNTFPIKADVILQSPDPIHFAVIGDFGSAGQPELDVANLVKSWSPEFIITLGDNNYQTGSASTIDQNIGQYYHDFIYPYTGSYGSGAPVTNLFFPALGNHDWDTTNAQPYLDYFTLPGNERYYDFVRGPVHFFVVDSDNREPDGITGTSTQAIWLQNQLAASASVWNVVYLHHPPYSSGSHGSTTALQWNYAAWGADVVLAGHEHDYERIFRNGIPYIINGLGGASISSFGTTVSGSQVRYNSDHGAMLVDADESQITFQFITRAGTLIDTYTLSNLPTVTPTKTPTKTLTPTYTSTATSTSTKTPAPPTATYTLTSTATKTSTPTATATNTPVPPSATYTSTRMATKTSTSTTTSTATNTPVPPSATYTSTRTATKTSTSTPTNTTTFTSTATVTSTNTTTKTPVPPTATQTPTFISTAISTPVVTAITRENLNPTSLASVNFTVIFSKNVTGVGVSDFSLTTTGVTGASIIGVSGSGAVYLVTVNTGSGNGTVRLDVVSDGTIKDVALIPLGAGFTSGESYNVRTTTFTDIPTTYWAWQYIERLYNAGITGGCSVTPLNYCPDSTVTRAQMAVFLLKGMHGSSFAPPAVGASTGFTDVAASYWAAAWIKQLAAEGITGGCGSGNYCPDSTVTRAQMAVFLLKAKHSSSYSPPAATGVFTDVPVGYWADKWIEQLASEGITGGCGTGVYCPDADVTRAQMAIFLVKTFNLP